MKISEGISKLNEGDCFSIAMGTLSVIVNLDCDGESLINYIAPGELSKPGGDDLLLNVMGRMLLEMLPPEPEPELDEEGFGPWIPASETYPGITMASENVQLMTESGLHVLKPGMTIELTGEFDGVVLGYRLRGGSVHPCCGRPALNCRCKDQHEESLS